jgi:hypothetical protein
MIWFEKYFIGIKKLLIMGAKINFFSVKVWYKFKKKVSHDEAANFFAS